MKPTQLQLNRIAQGLIPLDVGVAWFEKLTVTEQSSILRDLEYIAQQAHPTAAELPMAIASSGLKKTFTPCVVLLTAVTTRVAISRIASLPAAEHLKSFRLLLALFSIADARRRASQCKDGCTHEWHNIQAF
jgi:hypothetical protein